MKDRFKLNPKLAVIGGIALLVILITIGLIASQKQTFPADNSSASQQPDYTTLLPGDKTISELGDWHRVSPTNSDPVYAYTDAIDGTEVSVSQQPLPSSFKGNVNDSTAELARSYNATEKLTANGATVYLGNSSEGPQSVIFTKHNLLILIKSQARISNDAWVNYINSLK